MRIAMISEHASPLTTFGGQNAGGQNVHVSELAATLVRQGHEVRVYTRRERAGDPETVTAPAGYVVVRVPAGPARELPKDALVPHLPEFADWMVGSLLAEGWRPDVLHAHFWMSGLIAVRVREHTGVPVVLTYHALGLVKRRYRGAADSSPAERIEQERWLGTTVDRVVAQCRDELDELRRMGVPPDRVALISPGVDSERFSPGGPGVGRANSHRRVLTAGRMVARKGYADVIRALRLVPEAECVVVGGPTAVELDQNPLARRLQELADSCGVADRVRLVGAVPPEQMPLWYRSADIVAAASWYEPFGLVPLEAMACGVPVIGSAVGGITDTVVHQVTGQLVPPRNPRALGVAIRRLLRDEPRRYAYGVAGLDRARQRYSWQRCAEQLSAVYATLAGQHSEAVA